MYFVICCCFICFVSLIFCYHIFLATLLQITFFRVEGLLKATFSPWKDRGKICIHLTSLYPTNYNGNGIAINLEKTIVKAQLILLCPKDIEIIKRINKCCFQHRLLEQSNFKRKTYYSPIDCVITRRTKTKLVRE